jgi:tRNA A58 N-methylase Trm61
VVVGVDVGVGDIVDVVVCPGVVEGVDVVDVEVGMGVEVVVVDLPQPTKTVAPATIKMITNNNNFFTLVMTSHFVTGFVRFTKAFYFSHISYLLVSYPARYRARHIFIYFHVMKLSASIQLRFISSIDI